MDEIKFRKLKASEIDVRVGQVDKANTWYTLLLYQDSRCAMDILDETVGPTNWQRKHNRDNANCIVSIYDEDKKQWVEKEDTGIESNTQEQKGLASDSFKRACVNWGIGRELYSCPKIFIKSNDAKSDSKGTFKVTNIEHSENNEISSITIVDKNGDVVFRYPKGKITPTKKETAKDTNVPTKKVDKPVEMIDAKQIQIIHTLITKIEKSTEQLFKNFANDKAKENIYKKYKITSSKELTKENANKMIELLKSKVGE